MEPDPQHVNISCEKLFWYMGVWTLYIQQLLFLRLQVHISTALVSLSFHQQWHWGTPGDKTHWTAYHDIVFTVTRW